MYLGMIAFPLNADPDTHNKFINSLKIITPAVFLSHDESLIVFIRPDNERNHFYSSEFSGGHLRFSIGLEDPDDLIADIRQALKKCGVQYFYFSGYSEYSGHPYFLISEKLYGVC